MLDNGTVVAHINVKETLTLRENSLAAQREANQILDWVELRVSAFSSIHIPGVDNWKVSYISHQCMDSGGVSQVGMPNVDLLTTRFNSKEAKFVSRFKDPLAFKRDLVLDSISST